MKTKKKARIKFSEAASKCRCLMLEKDYIRPYLRYMPGLGDMMDVNLSTNGRCAGGCIYCTVYYRSKSDEAGLRTVGKTDTELVYKAIRITKPDIVAVGESIEAGLYPSALQDLINLRQNIPSDIDIMTTTKFPEKVLDVLRESLKPEWGNVTVLTTLSNPKGFKGMEPNVPSMDERVHAIMDAQLPSHIRLGVRLIVMQREDIVPLVRATKELTPYIDQRYILVGFLRLAGSSRLGAKAEFIRRMSKYVDMSQYKTRNRGQYTLNDNVIIEARDAFAPFNPLYDRLPGNFEIPGMRCTKVHDVRPCYIRKDIVNCLGTCCSQVGSTVCTGHTTEVKYASKANVVRLEGFDELICRNIADMTAEQHRETLALWEHILEHKKLSYGSKKGKGRPRFHKVLGLLRSPVLAKRTGLSK